MPLIGPGGTINYVDLSASPETLYVNTAIGAGTSLSQTIASATVVNSGALFTVCKLIIHPAPTGLASASFVDQKGNEDLNSGLINFIYDGAGVAPLPASTLIVWNTMAGGLFQPGNYPWTLEYDNTDGTSNASVQAFLLGYYTS